MRPRHLRSCNPGEDAARKISGRAHNLCFRGVWDPRGPTAATCLQADAFKCTLRRLRRPAGIMGWNYRLSCSIMLKTSRLSVAENITPLDVMSPPDAKLRWANEGFPLLGLHIYPKFALNLHFRSFCYQTAPSRASAEA